MVPHGRLGWPVRRHDEESRALGPLREDVDDVDGRGVRPVKVLEYENERPVGSECLERGERFPGASARYSGRARSLSALWRSARAAASSEHNTGADRRNVGSASLPIGPLAKRSRASITGPNGSLSP